MQEKRHFLSGKSTTEEQMDIWRPTTVDFSEKMIKISKMPCKTEKMDSIKSVENIAQFRENPVETGIKRWEFLADGRNAQSANKSLRGFRAFV